MPKLEIGLVAGAKLNFDQYCLEFNARKKYIRRVILDLTLNAEY